MAIRFRAILRRGRARAGLWRNEKGATAIEYGLIAALISLAAIIAFTTLGLNLGNIFNTITNAMK
ncbi:Flp family type IVb pilin [Parasphingopyxis marina]|uniref:Flp family type IVb pilin n=1 Tax=Parasphingopyxis marina TaxID=2761622 RepID=A0A842HWB0_9SPHN|nr:Flp family type IVb pilin [Parasphingopyxis marina]MBC2776763.1 Flp family type IVb pilin [Parasphingopyxis marina]